jgi:branched-chain amino acid transport system ATP-binding protein
MADALRIDGLSANYGKAQVLRKISIDVRENETVAILGRNGAGKSTLMKSIMGIEPPDVRSGVLTLYDQDIRGIEPFERAHRGIGYVPESREIFPKLTVEENLAVGKKNEGRTSDDLWTKERVYDLFPNLESIKTSNGEDLSGGEQQMLSIGRTLMGNPALLLLDEPAEGLAPLLVQELEDYLQELSSDLTVLLAEQNTRFGLAIADRVYVLDEGRITLEGSPDELRGKEEFERRLSV